MRLDWKVALITASGQGIGEVSDSQTVCEGWGQSCHSVISARRPNQSVNQKAEAREAAACAGDVTKVRRCLKKMVEHEQFSLGKDRRSCE